MLHALAATWVLAAPAQRPGHAEAPASPPGLVWLSAVQPADQPAPTAQVAAVPAPRARSSTQATRAQGTAHRTLRPSTPSTPPPPGPAPGATGPEPVRAQAPAAPASQAAPPAPSAEDWAFASRYTLKNSKAYRYTWGLQVRSMMGTAVAGPDQGLVRLRVEIAPDGQLTRVDTVWRTSDEAERRARAALLALPRWPATPTGQPLVFERTIAFAPYADDGPPQYKHDCEPDRPRASNRFAWDGQGAPRMAALSPPPEPDAQALADCRQQLPLDSHEAEAARDRRLVQQWASPKLAR